MVMLQCRDISAPGNQYSRIHKIGKLHSKCGLNAPWLTRKVDYQKTRHHVAVRTQIESVIVQV